MQPLPVAVSASPGCTLGRSSSRSFGPGGVLLVEGTSDGGGVSVVDGGVVVGGVVVVTGVDGVVVVPGLVGVVTGAVGLVVGGTFVVGGAVVTVPVTRKVALPVSGWPVRAFVQVPVTVWPPGAALPGTVAPTCPLGALTDVTAAPSQVKEMGPLHGEKFQEMVKVLPAGPLEGFKPTVD
ncbi:hypothetical protein [Amycolatopsis sp. EV170708-02-1]|uniref:hypothetical protein n=1 Tax=Amycolatopsis sp. EV170708-02-1 TaxID=2919322 RepID=UPI001F0C8EC7|nr:hypothetical protein [Amycolatopsis sp. EV170708-02-1]UMO99314.1 hypothetical protein MJQ72_22365 [Amycolatopsis sp. EV170708-02-1]